MYEYLLQVWIYYQNRLTSVRQIMVIFDKIILIEKRAAVFKLLKFWKLFTIFWWPSPHFLYFFLFFDWIWCVIFLYFISFSFPSAFNRRYSSSDMSDHSFILNKKLRRLNSEKKFSVIKSLNHSWIFIKQFFWPLFVLSCCISFHSLVNNLFNNHALIRISYFFLSIKILILWL